MYLENLKQLKIWNGVLYFERTFHEKSTHMIVMVPNGQLYVKSY